MTRLDESKTALLDWIEPRSSEVLAVAILIGLVSITAMNTVAPEGTLGNALGGWGVLLTLVLFLAVVMATESTEEVCDVCGHDVSEFPNYCAVCGSPLEDEEAEAVIQAARSAAREEAREVVGGEP